MQDIIVSVKKLRKTYKDFTAVHDLDLEIRKGEVFGILGPNGAGKTTTLECLEGMRKIDSGSIRIAGVDPQKQEKAIRRLLGVQLQVAALPENIQVREAFKLICGWHQKKVSNDLVERFGLHQLSGKQYHHLSTGQKRRLHLALALAANPTLILLDEPTAGLDVQARAQLHNIIRNLREVGVTILLATHDMAEAEALCDHIAILIHGRLATIGTPTQITAAARRGTHIRLRTEQNSLLPGKDIGLARFKSQDDDYGTWICESETARAVIDLLQQVELGGDRVEDLRVERPSLEEAFLDLVEGGEKNV